MFRRFRNQRASPRSPFHDSQACTPFISIKVEPAASQHHIPSTTEIPDVGSHQPLKRRKSSPEISQGKIETKTHSTKAVSLKRQRSSLPGLLTSETKPKVSTLKTSWTAPEATRPTWEQELPNAKIDACDRRDNAPDIDSEVAQDFLEAFLDHINDEMYQMFPRELLQTWARNSGHRTCQDLMAISAMLALGSVFSSRSDKSIQGASFCNVAKAAMEESYGEFCLQLVHSRLLLSLYYLALGRQDISWDYGGMAVRAALALRYNLESQCQIICGDEESTYGLNRFALAECKRRAFWSVYLLDVSHSPDKLPGKGASQASAFFGAASLYVKSKAKTFMLKVVFKTAAKF